VKLTLHVHLMIRFVLIRCHGVMRNLNTGLTLSLHSNGVRDVNYFAASVFSTKHTHTHTHTHSFEKCGFIEVIIVPK
jgi:hypothetical protein